MQPAVIQTQGLCRDFSVGSQVVHALRDVDLLIHRGEFIAIMGPSGSGKSTCMHVLGCLETPTAGKYLLDGEDVSDAIRRPEVTRAVGAYSDAPVVRKALVAQQRRMGAAGGIVAEGRDMAAVVFPCAELKISMVADLDERVERRYRELQQKGMVITPEQVRVDIETRDREDAARDYGVAGEGPEVTEIDTTDMTLEGQVDHIVALARQHGA